MFEEGKEGEREDEGDEELVEMERKIWLGMMYDIPPAWKKHVVDEVRGLKIGSE